ncbi:GNAT family N-acetyltransferase [Chloroflexi bacterium TSY]|nr:GNAT family N-acetyltransferase [Chloroflexi bacterium TSY]
MKIIDATVQQLEEWIALRKQLWDDSREVHVAEINALLASEHQIGYLLLNEEEVPVGFIEGALYLDGNQKYGYVEGWYVAPAYRKQGNGGRLLGALEQWVLHHAISLVLSDTIPDEYPLSPKAHANNGFKELMNLQIFVKDISDRNTFMKENFNHET